MEETSLPSEPTCIIRENETAYIFRGGIKLPNGATVTNLSGCTLENGSIIAFYYGDPTNRLKVKPRIVDIPDTATAILQPLTIDSTATIATETPIEFSPQTKQSISVSAVLIFFCVLAMLSAVANSATKRNLSAIRAISNQGKEREKKHCKTKSEAVSNKINEIIEAVEASRANKVKISSPESLYEEISEIMLEISILNKRLKNDKESKIRKTS
jgi:hypothetical protein